MKHVGLNVAADPFFTVAYTGVNGALVVVSADDPGMASSQNEQDNRHYAGPPALPMFEPSDSQEAYDFTLQRHCDFRAMARSRASAHDHARLPLEDAGAACREELRAGAADSALEARSENAVMIPAYARPAHRRLRAKAGGDAEWNEQHGPNQIIAGPADARNHHLRYLLPARARGSAPGKAF